MSCTRSVQTAAEAKKDGFGALGIVGVLLVAGIELIFGGGVFVQVGSGVVCVVLYFIVFFIWFGLWCRLRCS